MNVIGIDPGNLLMAAVLIREDGCIESAIAKGVRIARPSKKNPNPMISSSFFRTRVICESIMKHWSGIERPIYAVEAASFHSFGGRVAQDTQASIRQALFDCLAERVGIGAAESYFVTIAPKSAKKALTNYDQADKQRMIQFARQLLAKSPGMLGNFDSRSSKEQEAVADALGIALAVVRFPALMNRTRAGRGRIPLPHLVDELEGASESSPSRP